MDKTIIAEWGWPMKSIVSVEESEQCLTFSYENTIVPTPTAFTSWGYIFEGHVVNIEGYNADLPDQLSVIPAAGWTLITESPVMAPEWATTLITICQMLLG